MPGRSTPACLSETWGKKSKLVALAKDISIVVIAQIMYVMPTRTHRKQCLYKGAHTEEWRLA